MEFSLQILAFLFFVALLAGFLDTLAGGGGLLTLPALVVAGVPPLAALGTNKLQASVGSGTASLFLFKRKKIRWPALKTLMLSAFLGSLAGSILVQFIDARALNLMIPLVLLAIAAYFIAAPYIRFHASEPRMSERCYKNTLLPVIGAYDGMFGPGTGSFLAAAGSSLRALDLISATATAKPLNFATNIASLLVFIAAGQVVWLAGLVMLTGQMLGAWLGANYLFKANPTLLRLLIVSLCFMMLARYLYQALMSA